MTKRNENTAKLNAANEREIKASTKNLEVINKANGQLDEVFSQLADLYDRYEDGDRRKKAMKGALKKVLSALSSLAKLREYENETIQLCQMECNSL